MKKTIEKEVTFCDHCQTETYVDPCLHCGAEHCWRCRETQGIEYKHLTWGTGTGDGYYCTSCDNHIRTIGRVNPVHQAFLVIANLREESRLFYEDYKRRAREAEHCLEDLQRTKSQ